MTFLALFVCLFTRKRETIYLALKPRASLKEIFAY